MANKIKISLLAPKSFPNPHPHDPEKSVKLMKDNWNFYYSQVLFDSPDLIVMPEASDRFEIMTLPQQKEYYQFRQDEMLKFHANIARENHCYICYSTTWVDQEELWHNSTFVLDRQGKIAGIYNKNYPTIEETRKLQVLSGTNAPAIETDFGRLNCAICFDLNFEELLERIKKEKPKVIAFSSMYHGGLMQPYWAYTSRAYLAAAIKGEPSYLISPLGEVIAKTTNYFPFVTGEANLDYEVVHLDYNRYKLLEAKEKYKGSIHISDPGFVGAVLLTSEEEGLPLSQIIQEYEIELWDDYYARSTRHRYEVMENNVDKFNRQ